MKKTTASVFICFLLLFGSYRGAVAQNARVGVERNTVRLEQNQIVSSDYFASGESVEIHGTVNGDVYAIGRKIIIDGVVNGDVLAAGGMVEIGGSVLHDVRATGGRVTIGGNVARNMTIFAGIVEVDEKASINGSGLIGGSEVFISGPVRGNLRVGASRLTVSSLVNGHLDAGVRHLKLAPDAVIGGNLKYWSENDATIDPYAKIGGSVSKNSNEIQERFASGKIKRSIGGIVTVNRVLNFFAAYTLGIFIVWLFPHFTRKVTEKIKDKPLLSAGIGFLSLFMVPFVLLLFVFTVVGIPVAFIVLFLFVVAAYSSNLFVSLRIGEWLLQKIDVKTGPIVTLFIGLLLYSVLIRLPLIGGIISFLTLIVGLGAIIVMKKEYVFGAHKK